MDVDMICSGEHNWDVEMIEADKKRKAEADLSRPLKKTRLFWETISQLFWASSAPPEPIAVPAQKPVAASPSGSQQADQSVPKESREQNSLWKRIRVMSPRKSSEPSLEPLVQKPTVFTEQAVDTLTFFKSRVSVCKQEDAQRSLWEKIAEKPLRTQCFLIPVFIIGKLLTDFLKWVQNKCSELIIASFNVQTYAVQWIESEPTGESQDSTGTGLWGKWRQNLEKMQVKITVRKMCLLYTFFSVCLWIVFEYLADNMYCTQVTRTEQPNVRARSGTKTEMKTKVQQSDLAIYFPAIIWRARVSLAIIVTSMWIFFNGTNGRRNILIAILCIWVFIFPVWEAICSSYRQETDCQDLHDWWKEKHPAAVSS